ncbi:MAG TPA: YceI family protein [Dissulfurispiraceae bacterium]|nr:YceI family protein [Dissulfurispiraceae bacterium]
MAVLTIDPDHSVAAFSVRHMMMGSVRGQFNSISGRIVFDPANIETSSVEAEISAAGIYTGIAKRDDHLRSADFFEVEKHPKMAFKSTRVESAGRNRFTVFGDLTIKGISNPVTLEVEFTGPVKDPFEGGTSYGFSASAKINREDFGMTWNVPMENGGIVVGKKITIMLDIEGDLAK